MKISLYKIKKYFIIFNFKSEFLMRVSFPCNNLVNTVAGLANHSANNLANDPALLNSKYKLPDNNIIEHPDKSLKFTFQPFFEALDFFF